MVFNEPLHKLRMSVERMFSFTNADNPYEAFIEVSTPIKRVMPIESDQFLKFLIAQGMDPKYGRSNFKESQLRPIITDTAARAIYYGRSERVFSRVAEHEGKIYIDLANDKGEVVKIADGLWTIITNPPIKFIRRDGMRSLPLPVTGGDFNLIWPYVNVAQSERLLFSSWLLTCFHPSGPYPFMFMGGEQGSGKSTTMRVAVDLTDPNCGSVRSAPANERELLAIAGQCRVLAFDNLSKIPQSLSDALCRISTGTGAFGSSIDARSQLVRRPVVVNSIEDMGLQSDLLDRTLWISLPKITGEQRKVETDLWTNFKNDAPLIFGGLMDVFAKAMADIKTTVVDNLPRMADFARLSVAAERHFGFEQGAFMSAYEQNRGQADTLVVESSSVGTAIRKLLLIHEDWTGTAQDLLDDLLDLCPDEMRRSGRPPESPRKLSGMVRRVAPHLRRMGFDVDFEKTSTQRLMSMEMTRERSSKEWKELEKLHAAFKDSKVQSWKDAADIITHRIRENAEAKGRRVQPMDGMDGMDDVPAYATEDGMDDGDGMEEEIPPKSSLHPLI